MSRADFLSGEQADPLSGEVQGFVNNTGFIGKVKAARLWEMSSVYDPSGAELETQPEAFEKAGSENAGWWYKMWFGERDDGLLAKDILESEYDPVGVWRFTMRSDTITNIPADVLQDKFRDHVTGSSRTSMHHRYRHQLHMIALVAGVAAFARDILGYDVPDVSFDDLVSSETEFTDQLMYTLIGDPGEKDTNSPNHYTNSQYFKQRKGVWAALGESDPSKYNATYDKTPEASPTLETPNVTYTESEKLAWALGVARKKWNSATYARVLFVPDPHVDANHDFDKVPAIMEFYPDKAAAVKAGKAELAKRAERIGEADGGPAIPADWDASEWKSEMGDIRKALSDNGALTPADKRRTIEQYIETYYTGEGEDFAATPDDVLAHL